MRVVCLNCILVHFISQLLLTTYDLGDVLNGKDETLLVYESQLKLKV